MKKTAGKAATANRSPPSTKGETPRSATLMTTEFTPQRTTTSRASARSRGRKQLGFRAADAAGSAGRRRPHRRRPSYGSAAVDGDELAGDVPRRVRGEEHDGSLEV